MTHVQKVKQILPEMMADVADRERREAAQKGTGPAGIEHCDTASMAQASLEKAAAAVAMKEKRQFQQVMHDVSLDYDQARNRGYAHEYGETRIGCFLYDAAIVEQYAANPNATTIDAAAKATTAEGVNFQEAADLWDKMRALDQGRASCEQIQRG
eukprot:jgi/Chrzof1/10952/Cz05g18140.t1